MKKFSRQHHAQIIAVLILIILILLFFNLIKHELIRPDWLAVNKDSISAAYDIFSIVVLLIVSIFSYYRFFRGRTFAMRAQPKITATVHDTSDNYYIHAITVEIENVGPLPIWNPSPVTVAKIHGPNEIEREKVIDQWSRPPFSSDRATNYVIIETGETISFFAHQKIPKEAWAVTYSTSIRAESKDIWATNMTVSNIPLKTVSD
ncbi:hypothetical protein [Gimesia fumaroli]|uniref:Uncharacterized protein n=1 Tax=Gimesia fumaroli TaxID=2527976 RepID=A0A518ID79_9PLAN|nr:hypothetical protein [Gimesia fumaroli]QDV51009.1 hypothetical protein Enr17x_30610 [Gimesia fumaroli]